MSAGLPMQPAHPFRAAAEAMAQGLSWRNMALDAAVHDLKALTGAEIRALSTARPAPGTLLVVHPRMAEREITLHPDATALAAAPGRVVTEIALTGAGSSALGAAAFARTLADVTGRPCIAPVPPCGADEVAMEAMGGMFIWGAVAHARHMIEDLRHRMMGMAMAQVQPGATGLPPELGTDPASFQLIRLLRQKGRRVRVLTAHGAGAAGLAHALARLAADQDQDAFRRACNAQVVTAGMATPFPEGVAWVTRVMGQLDAIGDMNSPRSVPRQVIPMAGHHLNTALPLHLDFGAVLRDILGIAGASRG